MDRSNKNRNLNYLNDSLIQDYYLNYYHNLTTKQLDDEFNKDFIALSKALIKVPSSKQKVFVEIISRFIEFYIENKIDKEIENSLLKILNFND